MPAWLKGLMAGLLIGVAGMLLVDHLTGDKGVPEQLAEAIGCSEGSDGVHPSTAARAHRMFDGPYGYSWFAATHAERVLGVNGCDPVGPATSYLEFDEGTEMSHVLATLDNFGAVCVVGQAVFEGKVLDGREHLEELCEEVGGELKILHQVGSNPRFRPIERPKANREAPDSG